MFQWSRRSHHKIGVKTSPYRQDIVHSFNQLFCLENLYYICFLIPHFSQRNYINIFACFLIFILILAKGFKQSIKTRKKVYNQVPGQFEFKVHLLALIFQKSQKRDSGIKNHFTEPSGSCSKPWLSIKESRRPFLPNSL